MTRRFELTLGIVLCAGLNSTALGQGAPNSPAKPPSGAVIEGIVTREPGSELVKKTVIELIAENQAEGGDYTAISGADGAFRISGIVPGRYHLFAERTGFLEVDKHHAHSDGRVLTLTAGQELKDLQIRLQASAVVRGRVTDEDGDAMPSAQVTALRQIFAAGRTRWEQVGSERSNDLGEYRIAGLPAGKYYLSVSPPPDFKNLIEAAGVARVNTDAEGTPAPQTQNASSSSDKAPALSYQTTYYPGTTDRGQAAQIQLRPGDDFPVDFSLSPSPSLSIRGAVLNLPPHSSAVIMLQSHDMGQMLNGAEVRKDGTFAIHDLAPGLYDSRDRGERAGADDGAAIVANRRQQRGRCATLSAAGSVGAWTAAAGKGGQRWEN